jgi:hypothetical protein
MKLQRHIQPDDQVCGCWRMNQNLSRNHDWSPTGPGNVGGGNFVYWSQCFGMFKSADWHGFWI